MEKSIVKFEKVNVNTKYGKNQAWYRTVRGIVDGQVGAKAIDGEYVDAGREVQLPVGTLVLGCVPHGKKGRRYVTMYRVTTSGLDEIDISDNGYYLDWKDEFYTIIAKINELIS